MSTLPLQVAGIECQGDGADDEVKAYCLGAHQPLSERAKMAGERELADQAAQGIGGLETLQMANEPEAQQYG